MSISQKIGNVILEDLDDQYSNLFLNAYINRHVLYMI